MASEAPPAGRFIAELIRIIDSDRVVIDEVARKLLSTDLSYQPEEIADVVVNPGIAAKAFCAEHRDVIEPSLFRHDEPDEFRLRLIEQALAAGRQGLALLRN